MDMEISKKIAYDLYADVIITGQYIVYEKNIMIILQAIDIIDNKLIAITKVDGDAGKYNSIAVDGSNIYISYLDYYNGDLKFVKSTDGGKTW